MSPQQKYWVKMGKAFGYPSCCIAAFSMMDHIKDAHPRKLNGTGFIPCASCNTTKSTEELIKEINAKRSPAYPPFPA